MTDDDAEHTGLEASDDEKILAEFQKCCETEAQYPGQYSSCSDSKFSTDKDLLHVDGKNLTHTPLLSRKSPLLKLITNPVLLLVCLVAIFAHWF